jgi:two-component system, OmpR family, phosphate regulon response regulator OmpR
MYPEGQQVLVIDDDARRRQLIERTLIEEGFAVTAAAEGFSAIRAAASGQFVLVITAVSLPGTLDGPATIRQLRDRHPRLKALFTGDVSEWPRRPDRICDDFIPSPFHRRDLIGCVFELLQREIVHGEIAHRDPRRAG